MSRSRSFLFVSAILAASMHERTMHRPTGRADSVTRTWRRSRQSADRTQRLANKRKKILSWQRLFLQSWSKPMISERSACVADVHRALRDRALKEETVL
jgi:hypothetical protein